MAKEKSTAQLLDEQPKVTVKLLSEYNQTVQVNGYPYEVQSGGEIEVPETIAQILTDAGLI